VNLISNLVSRWVFILESRKYFQRVIIRFAARPSNNHQCVQQYTYLEPWLCLGIEPDSRAFNNLYSIYVPCFYCSLLSYGWLWKRTILIVLEW